MSAIRPTGTGASDPVDRNAPRGATSPTTARETATAESGTDDSVTVSARAREAARIDSSIARQPSFDSARVLALRDAIERGAYQVDSERLARAIEQLEAGL